MARRHNQSLHRLLDAGYEVSFSKVTTREESLYRVIATNAQDVRDETWDNTLGKALQAMLRKTALDE